MSKEKKVDANGIRKFGAMDKLAYAAGDLGCNMSFALKGTLSVFWMQFMKIDEPVYAMLLLIVQVWDAINDPLIGTLIDSDRRKYKLGKFRTYIFVGSIGLIVAGAACFIPVPDAPEMAKNLLFIFGYILWDAFYTVANVPYGSMLNLITEDPGERAQLSSWRSIGSMVGNMLPMAILPMLIYHPETNELLGERVFFVALIMGVAGFIFFQFMIRNTVERVNIDIEVKEDAPKFNFFKAFVNFLKNRPAMGATLAAVGTFVGMYGAQTASGVMFQAYFKNAGISGLITLIGMLPMFLFVPFIKKIVSKFGKKEACVAGALVQVIGTVLMLVLPMTPDAQGLVIYVVCQLIYGIGGGVMNCVSWSLMADAIDYNDWKFGNREEGTVYSLHSFFRKLAQGVGPTIGIFLATAFGYDGALGAQQPMDVATNMRFLTCVMYLVGAVIIFISVTFIYNLDKKTTEQMTKELNERRGNA